MFEIILDKIGKPNYHFKVVNWENHSWEIDDPYKYPTVLTDFDIHLFGEGNHYRIYEKLGAHSMSVEVRKEFSFLL